MVISKWVYLTIIIYILCLERRQRLEFLEKLIEIWYILYKTKLQMSLLALKRLNKDFVELMRNPIHGIGVEPLPDDMMNWHFTILPPGDSIYVGIPFHGSLEFSDKYPLVPPKIFFHHEIYTGGPSVSQNSKGYYSVCMSINQDWYGAHRDWEKDASHGWSGAS